MLCNIGRTCKFYTRSVDTGFSVIKLNIGYRIQYYQTQYYSFFPILDTILHKMRPRQVECLSFLSDSWRQLHQQIDRMFYKQIVIRGRSNCWWGSWGNVDWAMNSLNWWELSTIHYVKHTQWFGNALHLSHLVIQYKAIYTLAYMFYFPHIFLAYCASE